MVISFWDYFDPSVYRNNLKNRFLTASALQKIFYLQSSFVLEQGRLLLGKFPILQVVSVYEDALLIPLEGPHNLEQKPSKFLFRK